jgi:hypothetical protein
VPARVKEEPLPDEARASLTVISAGCSASELSRALAISADESWDAGEPARTGRPRTTTGISLVSRVPDQRSPAEHLADLLSRVEPLAERLRQLASEGHTVRLKLAMFSDSDNPMFTLPAGLLARVAALGIDLDLDIYEV